MRSRLLSLALVVAAAGCGGGGGHSSSSSTSLKFSANSLVYGVANPDDANFAVDELSPTGGTPKTVAADVDGHIVAFAADPSHPGRYILAADASGTGKVTLYLADGLSLTDVSPLVDAYTLPSIETLSYTPDGKNVVFTSGGSMSSVSTARGQLTPLGVADAATVSPADGDTLAYVAPVGDEGPDAVYTRSLAAGANGLVKTIVSDGQNHALPTFSRDGAKLAYWTLTEGANVLSVRTMATGATVTIPGVGGIEPQGVAFGPDGTTLAIVGQAGTAGVIATAPVDGSAAPTPIFTDVSNLLGNYGFFWTDANGRATSMSRSAGSASRHRKRG